MFKTSIYFVFEKNQPQHRYKDSIWKKNSPVLDKALVPATIKDGLEGANFYTFNPNSKHGEVFGPSVTPYVSVLYVRQLLPMYNFS